MNNFQTSLKTSLPKILESRCWAMGRKVILDVGIKQMYSFSLLLQQLCHGNHSISSSFQFWQNSFQHRQRPTPSVMADDNPSRPDHTQNVTCIDAPVRYLGVVRVDTTKNNSILETGHNFAHPFAEESGARTEIFWWWGD